MRMRRATRKALYVIGSVAAIAAVVLVLGNAAAPTTEGLILQAVGHAGTAAAGNRNEVYVLVSAYNAAGPIRGILGGSLSVTVVAAPANADPMKKVSVTEPASGVYKIALMPDLSSHRWSSGRYVLSVAFTSPSGTGVVVVDVVID